MNGIVARERLLKSIDGASRLVDIRAPAGFGKSVLLDQIEERSRLDDVPFCRLNLTPENSVEIFMKAAFADQFGIAAEHDREALVRGLSTLGRSLLLIDNAHFLAGSHASRKMLELMIRNAPLLSVIFAGRGPSRLKLARYAAAGELLQITPPMLLFDREEQLSAYLKGGREKYSAQEWDLIIAATSGWPCGLALQAHAGATIETAHSKAGVINRDWRLLDDYFEQEIVSSLPDNMASLLAKASVLEELNVADCEALLGGEGRNLLRAASESGAPLWPTDPAERVYTILPLFRQHLRSLVPSDLARELGERACDLLERSGRYQAASVQALAHSDQERAADLLEEQLKLHSGFQDETQLLALLERIAPDIAERHPRILLTLAQTNIFKFRFSDTRRQLDIAKTLIERLDPSDPEEIRYLETLLIHREMLLALGQHDLSEAQEHGDKLLRDIENVQPMQRAMILNSLTYAQQELYIFRGAERYYAQAKTLIPLLEGWTWSVPHDTFYARHLFQTGRTAEAIALLSDTLSRLVEELGPKPMQAAIVGIALAEMKWEVGETAEAAQLLDDYGEMIENFGFLTLTIIARIIRARLHIAAGEHDAGLAVLQKPPLSAGEFFEKLTRSLNVERVYWLLRLGREDAAKLVSSTLALSLVRPPEPHSSAGSAEEAYARAWVQLARSHRRLEDAIRVAQKWQRYTEGVGAIRSYVRWTVILASLRSLAGDRDVAMRHLRRAVKLGAPGQYRGAFLAEIDVLGEQMAVLVDSDLAADERAFLQSIVKGSRPKRPAVEVEIPLATGALSARETAMLRLIAKGHTNKEIGATLGLTEGTVKWYLHRIYNSLGIHRRSQVAMLVTQWQTRTNADAELI